MKIKIRIQTDERSIYHINQTHQPNNMSISGSSSRFETPVFSSLSLNNVLGSASLGSLGSLSPKGISISPDVAISRIDRFAQIYYASLKSLVVPRLLLPNSNYAFLSPNDQSKESRTPVPPLFHKILTIFQDGSGSFASLELFLHK